MGTTTELIWTRQRKGYYTCAAHEYIIEQIWEGGRWHVRHQGTGIWAMESLKAAKQRAQHHYYDQQRLSHAPSSLTS